MEFTDMDHLATVVVTGGFGALTAAGSAAYKILTGRFDKLDERIKEQAVELAGCEQRHDLCEKNFTDVSVRLATVTEAVRHLQQDTQPEQPLEQPPKA